MKRKEQVKLRLEIQYQENISDIIKYLDKHPVNLNIVDGTFLNYAVLYERVEIVKYLLNRNADINALYDNDYTSLMLAVEHENIEMTKILLENNADVNIKDKYGNTALWKAVYNCPNDSEFIRLLLKHGANPFLKNHKNDTAYDFAKDKKLEIIVKLFDQFQS